jgi:hypothetical protein
VSTCPLCKAEVEVVSRQLTYHGDCPGSFARVDLAETTLESRYTAASEACPHPERWSSSDWDSTEREVTELVAAFVTALQPDVVVETGSAFGQTAYAIGTALSFMDHPAVLHTIEPSAERYLVVEQLCADLPVEVHETTSLEWEPVDNIGFAWLDSLIDLRVPEFLHLYPHFAPGAIVGFHDTAPHHGKALWDGIMGLLHRGMLLPIRLPTPRGVVFGEVLRQ